MSFGNNNYHELIDCISSALDARDTYTAGHSKRVSDMARFLAKIMGFSQDDIECIHIAAHLHDIGKIGIADSVLLKDGKLTDGEFLQIQKHPQIGADILRCSSSLSPLANIILHHHERFDGKGYPSRLKNYEIPLGSRIIAICDSVDAMMSDRSYRKACTAECCKEEIRKNEGTMYDPLIAEIFLDHWNTVTGIA